MRAVHVLRLAELRGFEPATIAAKIAACGSFDEAKVAWFDHVNLARQRLRRMNLSTTAVESIVKDYTEEVRPDVSKSLAEGGVLWGG